MISSLTVSGLGSSILSNNAATPGENQHGHENSAALICIYKKRKSEILHASADTTTCSKLWWDTTVEGITMSAKTC